LTVRGANCTVCLVALLALSGWSLLGLVYGQNCRLRDDNRALADTLHQVLEQNNQLRQTADEALAEKKRLISLLQERVARLESQLRAAGIAP